MRNKYIIRLAAIVAMLALTVAVLVASSYAWFTMSADPEVNGIAIALAGSNTIQFAPDIVTTGENGEIIHYPGYFRDPLAWAQWPVYDYLKTIGSLTPVSTADGIHWFFPAYYGENTNLNVTGALKDFQQFSLDDTLSQANLAEGNTYAYVDFWVMSPAEGYDLRISSGTSTEGSFVLSMPEIAQDEAGGLYLTQGDGAAAASMRVGFLVNGQPSSDASMLTYTTQGTPDARIQALRGAYSEKGASKNLSGWNSFSIYEPNGDWHNPDAKSYVYTPNGLLAQRCENGSYVKTYPIGWDFGAVCLMDLTKSTTVQKTSSWLELNGQLYINQDFQAHLVGKDLDTMSRQQLMQTFTENRLQGLFDVYAQRGDFIKSSAALSGAADANGVVSPENMSVLPAAGATEDVTIVHLEKGTAQRIRMFIWLEGQDVDCVTHQGVWNTVIRLEFAGGD